MDDKIFNVRMNQFQGDVKITGKKLVTTMGTAGVTHEIMGGEPLRLVAAFPAASVMGIWEEQSEAKES